MPTKKTKTKKAATRRPAAKRKPSTARRRRVPKPAVANAVAAIQAVPGRIVSMQWHEEPKKKEAWYGQWVCIWCLVVGALIGMLILQVMAIELMLPRTAPMAASQTSAVEEITPIVDFWSNPGAGQEAIGDLTFTAPVGLGLSFQYPARLGSVQASGVGEFHFANNPDLFVIAQRPLDVPAKGSLLAQALADDCSVKTATTTGQTYCRPLTMAGQAATWHVGRFLRDGQPTTFLVASVELSSGDIQRIVIFADVGQPPQPDRNVFASLPLVGNDATWSAYFSAIDKGQTLSPVIADNVAAFDQMMVSLQVKS